MGGRYDWFGLVTGLQDGEYKGMNEVMIEGPKGKERKNGREKEWKKRKRGEKQEEREGREWNGWEWTKKGGKSQRRAAVREKETQNRIDRRGAGKRERELE